MGLCLFHIQISCTRLPERTITLLLFFFQKQSYLIESKTTLHISKVLFHYRDFLFADIPTIILP